MCERFESVLLVFSSLDIVLAHFSQRVKDGSQPCPRVSMVLIVTKHCGVQIFGLLELLGSCSRIRLGQDHGTDVMCQVICGVHVGLIQVASVPKGTRVTVAAVDYGVDPVEGDLVVSTRDSVGVLREDPRVGQVVVHFPRVGYAVRKVEAAG